ncbi:MAG: diversity-generating retroelement protein Avd [Saprospiraceae bacterium]
MQKAYDLLKFTIPVLNKYPRNQKFTLADRIQDQLSGLLELYIEAYYSSAAKKRPLLFKANIELEKLRHYFRLSYELGLFHSNKYEAFALRLNEIGQMTGGWLKSLPQ